MNCPICNCKQFEQVILAKNQPLARYGLCETHEEAKHVKGHTLDIVECKECEVMFNRSFAYSDVDYTSVKVQESRVFSPRIHRYMNEKVEQLGQFITENDDILEIGCGEGYFISNFKARVKIAFEPSTEGLLAEQKGVNVIREYFDPDVRYPLLNPKLIILRQVIEHLTEPSKYIKAFAQMLSEKDGGYLYIEVPNSNPTKEKSRYYDFYYEHFTYFTSSSLIKLVEQEGFTLRYCNEEFNGEILSLLCHKKEGASNISLNTRITDKITKLSQIVDHALSQNKNVVAWGTAGSGSSLLNLNEIDSTRIKYVIDSDERKQRKYIPGTGQLVVSPGFFTSNPPDVVIILSQFHKLDIIDQIKKMYGVNVSIVVPDEI